MSEVRVDIRGAVAIVTIDNPPVTALSQPVRSGIVAAMRDVDGDDRVNAAVLI